jgi:hypothetical protein
MRASISVREFGKKKKKKKEENYENARKLCERILQTLCRKTQRALCQQVRKMRYERVKQKGEMKDKQISLRLRDWNRG